MRYALCVGALTAFLIPSAAQAAILEEFAVKDWSGLALSDDQTGRLASCAIYSKYQNGATLFIIRHVDGGWALSLVHADWALTENDSYPLQYRVDREPYVEDTGIALGSDQIGVAFPEDDPVIGQIRRGTLLTVLFAGKEYGFELSNSGKALQAAKECLERPRDIVAPQIAVEESPVGPAPQTAAPPEPAADEPAGTAQGLADKPVEVADRDQRQIVGPWVVSVTRDDTGQFLNCTAFLVQGEDQLMLSHYPDEFWDFGLYRASWALDTDRIYELLYNVDGPADGAGGTRRSVEAVERTRVAFEVANAADLLARLETGRELAIEVRTGSAVPQPFRFRLDRAGEAFAATRECTERNAHGT